MKKLSIIFAVVLVLCLMTAHAFAQPYFELYATPPCPGNGNTTEVELWVKSMPCSNMMALDVCVSYEPTYLSIDTTEDITIDACISAFALPVKFDPDPGCIRIAGAQAMGTTCMAPTGDYLLATLTFTQIAEPISHEGTPVVASVSCGSSTCSSDPFSGLVGCEAGNKSPTDGCVNIGICCCILKITPDDSTIFAEETIDFDPIFDAIHCPSGIHNFYIDNPTECTGSINAATGLFTAGAVTAQEVCRVCVEDTIYSYCYEIGSDCCSNVTVNPLLDTDEDGVLDHYDNCPNHPNGPGLGLCAQTECDVYRYSLKECTSNTECVERWGSCWTCLKNQEDDYPPGGSGNDIGDACEWCYADFDGDGKVFPGDAMVLLGEWKREDCSGEYPCQADIDGNGKVYPADAMILLGEWKRKDCPVLP